MMHRLDDRFTLSSDKYNWIDQKKDARDGGDS